MKTLKSKKTIELIERYNSLTIQADQIKKERDSVRAELLKLKEEKQDNEFKAGSWKLIFNTFERLIFDKKSYLKEHGEHALDDYQKPTETTTIKIKHV